MDNSGRMPRKPQAGQRSRFALCRSLHCSAASATGFGLAVSAATETPSGRVSLRLSGRGVFARARLSAASGSSHGKEREVSCISMNDMQLARLADAIAQRVGQQRFHVWFNNSTRLDLRQDGLEIAVPNDFISEWIGRNFAQPIQDAAVEVLGGPLAVRFSVVPELFEVDATDVPRKAGPARSPRRLYQVESRRPTALPGPRWPPSPWKTGMPPAELQA